MIHFPCFMDNREDLHPTRIRSLADILRGERRRNPQIGDFSEETILREDAIRRGQQKAMSRRLASLGKKAHVELLTETDLFFAQRFSYIFPYHKNTSIFTPHICSASAERTSTAILQCSQYRPYLQFLLSNVYF